MSTRIVAGCGDILGPWVSKRVGGEWNPPKMSIGLTDEKGDILCAVLYENCSGPNLFVHIAAVPGRRWANRRFLWSIFHYPFVGVGCKRITAPVNENNGDSQRFVEHLGFRLEARLLDGFAEGDMLLYVMWRDECRFLEWGKKYGYESTEAPGARSLRRNGNESRDRSERVVPTSGSDWRGSGGGRQRAEAADGRSSPRNGHSHDVGTGRDWPGASTNGKPVG